MTAEIICVGTELLLGDIVNTNSQYLAQQLASLGIPHYYQTVVGDNLERLHQAIAIAQNRASILIFTGGLGPTPDDLTTEAIATFFQTKLVTNQAVLDEIEAKFAQLGRRMTANNAKQALMPEGATVLPNPVGTAPGIIWQPSSQLTILTFPGVPREMKAMWQNTGIPFLQSQGWGKEIIYSRVLKFRGIGESALAEKVNHLFALSNPTVAPYASMGEVRLRICAQAISAPAATELITPIAEEIKAIAGPDFFGYDSETIPQVVGNLLSQKGETLSVAESCTGGGVGNLLTAIPGSSQYFYGGIIAYDNSIKVKLLKVDPTDLENFGAVSEVVAKQMALNVKEVLGTDWGISITGIAGPGGGTETKPVGLVYSAIATPEQQVYCLESQFGAYKSREAIRDLSAHFILDQLRRKLLGVPFT